MCTGYDPIDLSYLCRILHAAAHFDLLSETSDDKYTLTPLSQYLTSTHPKSLKGFVKLYSGNGLRNPCTCTFLYASRLFASLLSSKFLIEHILGAHFHSTFLFFFFYRRWVPNNKYCTLPQHIQWQIRLQGSVQKRASRTLKNRLSPSRLARRWNGWHVTATRPRNYSRLPVFRDLQSHLWHWWWTRLILIRRP